MNARLDVAALFREHNLALFRYLLRVTDGDEAASRDAVQHAFVTLLERWDEITNPRAWLYRVATTAARGRAAQDSRRHDLLKENIGQAPRPDTRDTPLEELEREERIGLVRVALADLPEKERIVLLMREEGFKHREIAEAVGTTTGSVGTMIARALERLAERLSLDETDGNA